MSRVASRPFGQRGDLRLSQLAFGSMRLEAGRIHADDALDLLTFLVDAGVTTMHSSHEYAGYPFFCDLLRRLRRRRPDLQLQHIYKLAEPDFGDRDVRPARLTKLVDDELRRLGTERVHVAQWLFRATPNDDATRQDGVHRPGHVHVLDDVATLPRLRAASAALLEQWELLRQSGKVQALACFPYTVPFARAVLDHGGTDGLATYLNLIEQEAVALVPTLAATGGRLIAIRPLAAGRLAVAERSPGATGDHVASALAFPLLSPAVSTVVLGVSSLAHARVAVATAGAVQPDAERFARLAAR